MISNFSISFAYWASNIMGSEVVSSSSVGVGEWDYTNEVLTFRDDYSTVLSLTTETVQVSDKIAVQQALAAYGLLTSQSQTELTPEADLLTDLLAEIIAFENSEFLDFEAQAYDSGLTGTVDINGRTWYANDVYISNDSSYDVWNDTRSLALRNNAYFQSNDLFINGIDSISLYHGALNYGNGSSFQFYVEYELGSNPGTWVRLQSGGVDLVIDIISSTPLSYTEIDVNIAEAVNIRFTADISSTDYLNLDDIRIYEHVVTSSLEVETFRTIYAGALDLTPATVQISDKVSVQQALAAYDLLSVEAQAELTSEKTLLDSLILEINIQEAYVEATNAVITAESTYLQADLDAAQVLVSALPSSSEKTALQNRLDDVQDIIDEISLFETTYASTLSLSVATVQVSDKIAVQQAIAAYNSLSLEAQGQLTSQKALLDSLLAEIYEQIPTETQVSEFRSDHATALALTLGTVQVSDQAIVQAALDAYDLLTPAAQAELSSEKALLDSLILQISIDQATTAVENAETSYLQADLDAAQLLVSLLPSGIIKTDLQDRLDTVQDGIDSIITFRDDYSAVLSLTTETVEVGDKTAIQQALTAYGLLSSEAQAQLTPEVDLLTDLLAEIIAFENSEFLDFEAQPYDSGLTGTVVINGRTWYGNDIYISNDPSYDVWNDTRSLALRDNAYFQSNDLFINGIDTITLYYGALNYGSGQTYQFYVEYELGSNPGTWIRLQSGGSDLVVDIISSTPLSYTEIDVNITEAVNVRFTANNSSTDYINLDDIRIYEHVVSSALEVETYNTIYTGVLDLSLVTVEISDQNTIQAALDAYDLLSVEAQTALTSEKALLDSLILEINNQIQLSQATAAVENAETTYLQADLDAAQTLVTALPSSTEKTALQDRLDDVEDVIDEISSFETTYASTLLLSVATVQVSDKTAVQQAIADYNLLSINAQAQLSSQKALLDSLLAEINEQIPTATQVADFRADHATALALTLATVQVSDQAIVQTALTAYDALTPAAQTELSSEKALLDSLVLEILTDEATELVLEAERSNLQADVDSAQAVVSQLPSGTVKTDLQDRLDTVQNVIHTQAANQVDVLILAIPSSGSISLSDATQITQARAAYSALTIEAKALVAQLSILTSAETEISNLQTATNAVILAEGSQSQADVNAAQSLVTALVNGTSKTALQNRLTVVQDIIDVAAVKVIITNYFGSNSVVVSRLNSNTIKQTAFLAKANEIVDSLDVVITITNTNRISSTNTIYTITVSKNGASQSFTVSVTFTR